MSKNVVVYALVKQSIKASLAKSGHKLSEIDWLLVYGLDINPRAVKISWINLYLNALDENGQPVYDQDNKTLLDRVEFYESDLLSYSKDNNIELERIVGCIPQILNPNPEHVKDL
ncbi:methionine S-methyltransferase [Tanacetum coccineum]